MEECSNMWKPWCQVQSQSDELANRKLVMIDDYDILTTRYSAVLRIWTGSWCSVFHVDGTLLPLCGSSRKEQLRNTDSSLSAMAAGWA